MKILNLSNHDYAGFAHDNKNALEHNGSICDDFKLHPHRFEYPSQSRLIRREEIPALVKKYDIVQIFHSDPVLLEWVLKGKPKRLFVWHTGSRYRQDPEQYNDLFNPHVEKSFIALGEFAGLGAKNEIYSVGAINTGHLHPRKIGQSTPLSIMHLPSSPSVKGTDTILEMIDQLTGDFKFQYKIDPCPYQENIDIMQTCDIYIELFSPEQNGKTYGSWGITALEAAAMGKIVFTQHLSPAPYLEEYYDFPKLETPKTKEDFVRMLQYLIDNPQKVKEFQAETLKWVRYNHSYLATGQRLREIFENKSE